MDKPIAAAEAEIPLGKEIKNIGSGGLGGAGGDGAAGGHRRKRAASRAEPGTENARPRKRYASDTVSYTNS